MNLIIYYRPVALTSVEIKSFQRLVLAHLKSIIDPLLDPLQFAYKANISVDNTANNTTLLFLDISSAFAIIPALLLDRK